MGGKPLLTIVVATFNSERLLPLVLSSVRKQTFLQSKIEILVVDGGSTDSTKQIAKNFGCRILHNPKTLPAWAKYIGYKEAGSKFLMYLDSDEVIENEESLEKKMDTFKNLQVKAVTSSGYKNPKSFFFLNRYINEFGDPFSFFIYRLSKDYRYFIPTMKQRYKIAKESAQSVIFDFTNTTNLPIFELVAMGSIVDREFLTTKFPEIIDNPGLIPHFFNLLISKDAHIAITKNDSLIHHSSDTTKKYLGKITSRIVNNIYTSAKEGFRGRDELGNFSSRIKKYLFIPYAFSLIFPFMDALSLIISRRHIGFFIHIPLTLYTAYRIVYYMSLKLLHVSPVFKSYGEGEVIKRTV